MVVTSVDFEFHFKHDKSQGCDNNRQARVTFIYRTSPMLHCANIAGSNGMRSV